MKPITIAFFDAEPINQFLGGKLLSPWKNASLHVYNTLEESQETVSRPAFDVAFIDLHFTGKKMKGVTVLQQLRKLNAKPFVAVAMTNILLSPDIEATRQAGFEFCIEHPLTHNDIRMILSPLMADHTLANTPVKDVEEKGISLKDCTCEP